MKGTVLLVFFLEFIQQISSCELVDSTLFCTIIPREFPSDVSTLVISVKNAGEINSTVFHHDNLLSVRSLIIRGGGITRITEGAFGSFLQLTSLTLDQNMLTDINHKWLGSPGILADLSISENHIPVLSRPMLAEFTNLTKLNLSRNEINTIQPGTFSNLTALAQLDLSNNNLTQLTSQMFNFKHNVKMSLQGNRWVCSCNAQDFIVFIIDLKSRSLLLHAEDVTCTSPPSLKGQPVWNISVCNPPTSSNYPSRETETTDLSQETNPTVTTFHDLTVSKPAPGIKTTLEQKTMRTMDTSAIRTHQPPPYSPLNIVPMLITIIVVLCVVLLLVIVLAIFYRRKHNRTIVAPKEQSHVVTVVQGHQKTNVRWDIETPCHMPFTRVRAQSANAILSTFTTGVTGELHGDPAPTKDQNVEEDDGIRAEGGKTEFTSSAGNVQNATSHVDSENVSYLCIGSCPSKPNDLMMVNVTCPAAKLGRALHRISTWPPTAVQWQERCKRQREHEDEAENVQLAWTQIEECTVMCGLDTAGHLSDNVEQNGSKTLETDTEKQVYCKKDETQKGKDLEKANMSELTVSSSSMGDKNNLIFSDSFVTLEEVMGKDYEFKPTVVQRVNIGADRGGTSGMGNSKQRGKGKRSALNAPSGGGGEYVFADLLNEVVQNRGRWTRERWRQIHMNK